MSRQLLNCKKSPNQPFFANNTIFLLRIHINKILRQMPYQPIDDATSSSNYCRSIFFWICLCDSKLIGNKLEKMLKLVSYLLKIHKKITPWLTSGDMAWWTLLHVLMEEFITGTSSLRWYRLKLHSPTNNILFKMDFEFLLKNAFENANADQHFEFIPKNMRRLSINYEVGSKWLKTMVWTLFWQNNRF